MVHAAGLAFAAMLALSSLPGHAQSPAPAGTSVSGTANTDDTLLAPSLPNALANPPTFRAPGEPAAPPNRFLPPGTVTGAQSRIGATPVYGSPSGFGAGDTGFDSSNTPHSKRRKKLTQAPPLAGSTTQQADTTFAPVPNFAPPAPSQPPVLKRPLPAEIAPKKAARRPGASLPPPPDEVAVSNPPPEVHPLAAANRIGAVIAPPPAEHFDYTATPAPTLQQPNTFLPGTLPERLLPIAETDPYAALGIRAGSFLLLPSLDLNGGYSSNPERTPAGSSPGSPYLTAVPELRVQSDWERHSLTADVAGSYTQFTEGLVPSLNLPFLNSKVDARIDVTRDTQINLEQRVIISSDNPGSPNLQAELARLPPNQDVGETLGLDQQFNRLSFSLRGTFDRATYNPSELTNGQSSTNSDRNFDQYAGIFRVGYELNPGLKPFLEVQEDERIHDEQFDRSGLQRDSVGTTAKLGSAVDLFGSLTGAMAIGYVERTYKAPTLPQVSGVIADGTLLWKPTGLTTAKLSASSQVYETVLAGASGELSRDVSLEVDHAFRAWLIGVVKAGYGTDNYVGLPLSDNRYFVSVGMTYIFTRELQARVELRQDWQNATESDFSYTATTFLVGLHLQR